jgi:hypothetical protein
MAKKFYLGNKMKLQDYNLEKGATNDSSVHKLRMRAKKL